MKIIFSLVVVLTIACEGFSQATIEQLLNNGPKEKRINIVFLSEAYPSNKLSKFITDATASLNYLMSVQPWKEYKNYFNAYAISVASVDSGADHPQSSIKKNTYFNSTYFSYGIERLLTIPPNDSDGNYSHGAGRVDSLLQAFMPQYDIVLIIVNDGEYGGAGGGYAVTSINVQSPEIAAHELGHSFAHLGDEYGDPYPGFPDTEEPNTTKETNRDAIKWKAWILPSTPIPTPQTSAYANVVGLFEGAHYHNTLWYRPKLNCKMRGLGVDYCEVCREELVKSVYSSVRPVDSALPATSAVTMTSGQTKTLSAISLLPATHGFAK